MASNTKNVRLGVCSIVYNGQDLGYTKGGVEVSVTTNTFPLTVDQFGESPINEYITKRDIKVKIPLAETTLENLVATMPGATLVSDGAYAVGVAVFLQKPTNGITLTLNGTVFTFKNTVSTAFDIKIGADIRTTIENAVQVINNTTDAAAAKANVRLGFSGSVANRLVVTYDERGVEGDDYTIATSALVTMMTIPVSGHLAGGVEPTQSRVDVTNGVGSNLLDYAGPLVLHPIDLPVGNKSEDLVVPIAATPGSMKFSYKFDEERVYDTEFTGYPDPLTKKLFSIGDAFA